MKIRIHLKNFNIFIFQYNIIKNYVIWHIVYLLLTYKRFVFTLLIKRLSHFGKSKLKMYFSGIFFTSIK